MKTFALVEPGWGAPELGRAVERARSSGSDLVAQFEHAFAAQLPSVRQARFQPSARVALRTALRSFTPVERQDVIVPAFCCAVVAEAILGAGKRLVLVDSGPEIGSLDMNQVEAALRRGAVAAIVVPHLFGLPLDTRPLRALADAAGAVLIEDCAHCLGGVAAGAVAGTRGDFAIFSFNHDKPISLGGGGMLVTTTDAALPSALPAASVELEAAELARHLLRQDARRHHTVPPSRTGLRRLRGLLQRHPAVSGMLWTLLRSRQGASSPPDAAHAGPVRAALGLSLLPLYPGVMALRNANHLALHRGIQARHAGHLQVAGVGVQPAWLRAKLQLPAQTLRPVDDLANYLLERGFPAGRSNWPRSLDQEPAFALRHHKLGPLRNAHAFASTAIDLPVHQVLSLSDIEALSGHIGDWVHAA